MIDAGVILRALDHENPVRRGDATVADCRTLWERALRESRVLMPPFVFLEVLAGAGGRAPFPVVSSVEHVGFSYRAAEIMAPWVRPATGKRGKRDPKSTRNVVGYDALIVGTAAFHEVEVLVSLEPGIKALGKLAGVRVVEPHELLKGTQGKLFASD